MYYIFTFNKKWNENDIEELIKLGCTKIRVNGVHIEWSALEILRKYSDLNLIDIYFDLPGNKSRIWINSEERIKFREGDKIVIYKNPKPNEKEQIWVTGELFWERVEVGELIRIRRFNRKTPIMKIDMIENNKLYASITQSGIIGSGYHIYSLINYWENKDISRDDYLQFKMIEYLKPKVIAVSFADSSELIHKYKNKFDCNIFAKIESPIALKNFKSIADSSDGIIVGRDDLSAYFNNVEIDKITKYILSYGRTSKKKVIGASNYFYNVFYNKKMSDIEKKDLDTLIKNDAYGIYINETNKDPNWKKYINEVNKIIV